MSHSPRRRRRRALLRAVVGALVLLIVLGMVLAMAGTALAGPGTPTGPGTPPASPKAARAADPGRAPEAERAPVVVLATHNVTWADIEALATGEAGPEAARAAVVIASSAAVNEPVNLVVRTVGEGTCPADGWLTLGDGSRLRAAERTKEGACTWPADIDQAPTGTLTGILRRVDVPVLAVGPGAELALTVKDTAGTPPVVPQTAASLTEALATLSGPTLLVADTDPAADQSPTEDAERVTALAAALTDTLAQAPAGTRVLLLSLADDQDPGPQMAVLPAGTMSPQGSSGGLVVGSSTHRAGLIQLPDLAPTLLDALTGLESAAFTSQALALPAVATATPPGAGPGPTPGTGTGADPMNGRPARLADDALHARASRLITVPTGVALTIAALVVLVTAGVVLRSGDRAPAAAGGVHRAALLVVALPLGVMLANVFPWWRVGAGGDRPSWWVLATALGLGTVLAVLLATAAWALWAVLSRRRPGRGASPTADTGPVQGAAPTAGAPLAAGPVLPLAILTCAVILLDGATGAHLAFNGPLGMNAVVAGRFYGMSNTAFALAAGALLVAVGALVGPTARALTRPRNRRLAVVALVGAVGAVAVVLDGAPRLGADIGGVLALVPALVALGAGLAEVRMTWWRWLVAGAGAVMAVSTFALVDLMTRTGPTTHLSRFATEVLSGQAGRTVARKAWALVAPFTSNPLALVALGAGVLTIAGAGWWLRLQLRSWRAGTSAYRWLAGCPAAPWLGPVTRALGVLVVVEVLLNDSGAAMAVFTVVVALPALLAWVTAQAVRR